MNQSNIEVISFQGGDGSSVCDAVKITGALNFASGIEAEFEFIQSFIKNSNIQAIEGSVISFESSTFHHVKVVTTNNEIRNIFFDASEFQKKIENESIEFVKEFSVVN
jgi:hypothetical protein